MKSTAVTFLFLLSTAWAMSLTNDIMSNVPQLESLPSISEGRAKRATASNTMGESIGLGSTLGDLVGATGLTKNETMSNLVSGLLNDQTIRSLQNTLNSLKPADVKGILQDSSPLAKLLDNIPVLGPILNLLRNVLNLVGNLLDRVVNLVVSILHCVAASLPKLLE